MKNRYTLETFQLKQKKNVDISSFRMVQFVIAMLAYSYNANSKRCVIDLFDENENFADIEMLKRKFNIQTNYFIQIH